MTRHEETFDQQIESKTKADPRLSPSDEHSRRPQDAQPAPSERTLAAHPGLIGQPIPLPATKNSLKFTEAFRAVYRRGRWVKGVFLSVGTLPNTLNRTRIGLRTRRGLKGAATRNRLKRQIRAIVYTCEFPLRTGLDIVIVIHPTTLPARTDRLEKELLHLCKRAGALS